MRGVCHAAVMAAKSLDLALRQQEIARVQLTITNGFCIRLASPERSPVFSHSNQLSVIAAAPAPLCLRSYDRGFPLGNRLSRGGDTG